MLTCMWVRLRLQLVPRLELACWELAESCQGGLWVTGCPGAAVCLLVDEAGSEVKTGLLVGGLEPRGFWGCCLCTGGYGWVLESILPLGFWV